LIECDDDDSSNGLMSYLSLGGLTAGSTVYLRFWEYGGDSQGTFGICVTAPIPPVGCGTNPAASDYCGSATPICNMNGYCGNTSSSYGADQPGNLSSIFCGSIENNSWLSFVADSTTAVLNVNVSNCSVGDGIQMEIYSTTDCVTFVSHSNCWNPGYETSGTISATGLTIGQTFYLMIDGYAGDVCDYSISAASGVLTPEATATSSNICAGQSTQLTATGGSSYHWSPATGLSNPNIANPIANPTTTTTYIVTVTGGSTSCPATATAQVTITVSPGTPATAGSNSPICQGASLNLTALPAGATSYNWSGPNGFVSAIQNPSIAASTTLASGTYTVTVTTTGGCSSTATTIVTVNSTSTANITGNSPLCVSSTLSLSVLPAGATSYNWSGPNSFVSAIQNPSITPVSAANAGVYNVTVTMAGGCTSTGSYSVVVNPLPSVSASNNSPVCEGQTINLSSLPSLGTSYLWSGPLSYSSVLQNPSITTATNTMGGTYTVTVTLSTGCTGTAQTQVTINTGTAVTPSSNSPICEGQTLILTLPITGTSYLWSGPNSFSSNIQNPTISNATTVASGTYNVTVTNASGCSSIGSVNVSINSLPIPLLSGDTTICVGQATSICASGGTTFLWSNSLTTSCISVSPLAQTSYSVTVSTAAGCSATATKTVYINPNPQVVDFTITNELCTSSNGALTVNVSNGQIPYNYLWSFGNLNTATISNLAAGNYSVTITDLNGCSVIGNSIITNTPAPIISIININDDHCDQAIGQATVNVNNSIETYIYTWQTTPAQIGNIASGLSAGNYSVIATNGICSDTLTVSINNIPGPIANFEPTPPTASFSNPSIHFVNTSIGGSTFLWNFNDGLPSTDENPFHNFTNTQFYTVLLQVTDAFGCVDTISKTIQIVEDINIYIPNTFTPNGDGINEVFRPYGSGYKTTGYEMLIYDRWGKLIFTSNVFEKGWDGKIDGVLATINGVFTYKMIVFDLRNSLYKYNGFVVILGSKQEGN
ncbi:MAG: gliding motility-associated C-terminal domain-containing protein, partial [Bacteroidota bacterium]